MKKLLIICFVCVFGFWYCLNEPKKTEVKKSVVSGSETALKILETAESQLIQIIDPQTEPMHGEPRRLSSYVHHGWTGDQKFQDDYEKAVREYDRKRQALPPGLVLPGGETVQERIDSGRVYGK